MGVLLMLALAIWFFLGALYFYKLDLIVDQPEYPEGCWRRVVISHRCYFESSRAGTLAKCILAKTTRGAIPT